MIPKEHCPYCGSEEIFFHDTRFDYMGTGEMIIETAFCECKNCKKKFNTDTNYTPSIRHYYSALTYKSLREEALSNE